MKKYNYLLMDENGANTETFTVKVLIGSFFEFYNSTYEVVSVLEDGTIICHRL